MKITKRTKTNEKEQWFLIDAENKVLGRLATKVANILSGKVKTHYSHDVICGDFVIVINAAKVKLTGNKLRDKIYYHHSFYPGGLKEPNAAYYMQKKPEFLIEHAVKGMLPRNKLRKQLLTRLKLYKGSSHPHEAQQPIAINL